jgi:hypothetical protein
MYAPILLDFCSEITASIQLSTQWQRLMKPLSLASYTERLETKQLNPLRLQVLADACEESGEVDDETIAHLRQKQPLYRGCWSLDRVLRAAVV